jgi:hypothetical protein|tara:strand:- start:75 stop:386 length:312 start_codon:yes stop_codon:yes gene_type:complete
MFEITQLGPMAKKLGKAIAKDGNFTVEELKEYIKVSNIKQIIKEFSMIRDGKLYIDEDGMEQAAEQVYNWLIGVDLAKLAGEDLVDCYWDSEQNCMTFENKEK